jgi:hypothetical protein
MPKRKISEAAIWERWTREDVNEVMDVYEHKPPGDPMDVYEHKTVAGVDVYESKRPQGYPRSWGWGSGDQTQKVYDTEIPLYIRTRKPDQVKQTFSQEAAEAFVKEVAEFYGIPVPHLHIGWEDLCPCVQRTPSLLYGALGMQCTQDWAIWINKPNRQVILHEMAHAAAPMDRTHGPDYTRARVDALVHFRGREVAANYIRKARARGVKIAVRKVRP